MNIPNDASMTSSKIISFENVDGKEVMNFDKIRLQEILRPVKGLPICIISVTSKEECRLITFLLEKFLKNEMPTIWNTDNIPQFPKVIEAEKVCGIWIHGEPLIVSTNDDSETIAVLLLEATGNYAAKMDESWKKTVGLSMYLSSQMIMSCSNFIPEHVLSDIKLNCPTNEDKVGLKQLIFLIQDWNKTSEYPWGANGGDKFLQAKFKEVNGQLTRQAIKMSFEAIQCFLLPNAPLPIATRQGDKNNYLSLAENFFSRYFSPNNLIVKHHFGKELKAGQLPEYLEMYTAVLTGGDSKGSLAKATIKQFKEMQIKGVNDFYRKNMRKILQAVDITKEEEEKAHITWKEKAIGLANITSYGYEDIMKEINEALEENVTAEFSKLKTDCHKVRVDHLIDRAVENYRKAMNEKFPGLESNISTETEDIKSFSSAVDLLIMTDLEETIELLGIDSKLIIDALSNEKDMYVMKNETIKVEKELTMEMDTIYLDCCNAKDLSDDAFEEMEQVDEYLAANKEYAIDKLTEAINALTVNGLCDENVPSKYKNILQERMDEHSQEVTESWQKRNRDKMTKIAQNTLITVFMQFEENMKAYDEPQTEQKMVNNYEKFSEEARTQFLILGESLPGDISEEFIENLNSKMLALKNDVVEAFKRKMKIIEETFMNAYTHSLSCFSNKFLTFSLQKQFYDDEILNRESEKLKQDSIQVFNSYPKMSHNAETNVLFLSKLKSDIDMYSNEIVTKYRQTRENILTQISNKKERCQKLFDDEFKKSYRQARDEENLKKEYEKAHDIATNEFLSQMQDIDDEVWDEDLEEIESYTLETYNVTLEICQMKWNKQERITKDALVGARAFYHEQMKTHQSSHRFFNPTELDKIHKKTARLAIAKASESVTLNSDQKADLENYLKVSYKQYKDQNLMNLPQDPVIGIDLGTTYTCVALYHKGETIVITNRHGQKTTPSYVAFRNGLPTVGFSAKKLAYANPQSTIFDAKRLIGLQFNDPNVQSDILQWPFKVIEDNTKTKIQIDSSTYYPEQISAKLLQEMKTIAEDYIGTPGIVKKCVITVPARFNDSQREATIDAGGMAGMEVIRIINEPTAAAIAYKMNYSDSLTRNILIFDLGGGTFDVAILEMKKGEINVKAVDGNAHLGGEDFDNRVAEFCTQEFERINKKPLFPERDSINLNQQWNYQAIQRLLRDACEEGKIHLSTETEVHVVERNLNLDVVLTREKFEELNEDLFEETIEIVEQALNAAKLKVKDIDDIVLVGGSTRIPKIQKILSDFFEGRALNHRVHPDEAVAIGAAIQAAIHNGEILKGTLNYNELSDVTPFSIGIEVLGGGMSVIIPRNTAIPTTIDHPYITAENNQTTAVIKVFQGEKIVAVDNVPLGEFILNGIPRGVAGKEIISVKMEIDFQGVLHVTAICVSNGVTLMGLEVTEQKWRLTRETIQRILSESTRG